MKLGPILKDTLLALWRSVVDPNYGRVVVEAGEGNGFEAYTQAAAQLERLSQSIDTSTQALYIRPSAAQTAPPASGAKRATVTLTVSRIGPADRELVLSNDVVFNDETTDYSPTGPIVVSPGRKFRVLVPATFGPGMIGPLQVQCEAVVAGYSANNALPGNIKRFTQAGQGFTNDGASVGVGVADTHRLVARPDADVPVPFHVGLYLTFTAGSNLGETRRIAGYEGPDAGVPHGGVFLLAATARWSYSATSGVFEPGETAEGPTGKARVWSVQAGWVIFDRIDGTFVATDVLTGYVTGATVTLLSEEQSPDLVAESGTAGWRVLDWELDLGCSVTNLEQPTGGTTGMLDALGWERKVDRAPGEDDEQYRKRVATPADVVSPNALRRAANRVLAPFGYVTTLREVGLATLPGFYYDGDPSSTDPAIAFAYDFDLDVRPEDRLKPYFDYVDFRAFFLMEIPHINAGDFGFAYDDHPHAFYDAGPGFYDGFPASAGELRKQLWSQLNAARGGGVGFDIVEAP